MAEPRMQLGVIGAGAHGITITRLAALAGYEVLLANSRDPETLEPVLAAMGPLRDRVTGTSADIVAQSELLVLSIPVGRYPTLELPVAPGTVILDTGNFYLDRDGHISALEEGTPTSALLQQRLPTAHVVKAANNVGWPSLQRLSVLEGASERSALPIYGDDTDAVNRVERVMWDLGWSAVCGGRLEESWRSERRTPAYVRPYMQHGNEWVPRHVGEEELSKLLQRAKRS